MVPVPAPRNRQNHHRRRPMDSRPDLVFACLMFVLGVHLRYSLTAPEQVVFELRYGSGWKYP